MISVYVTRDKFTKTMTTFSLLKFPMLILRIQIVTLLYLIENYRQLNAMTVKRKKDFHSKSVHLNIEQIIPRLLPSRPNQKTTKLMKLSL